MNDPGVIDAIERIVVAGVAMTNASIVRSRPNLELTLQQWRVLVVLGEAPDGRSVGEIARQIAVTLPATSRQLRRMEERGLLTLEPDGHDRRVTRARLTEAGISARASIILDRRTSIAAAIGDLRTDPDLVGGLVRIAAALETAEASR
jgi:DNA-binding MarR family transcriptional regulator